jgi:hypothetical protein
MEEPYDYREVSLWFLNDESLHTLAEQARSGGELWELCNNFGILEVSHQGVRLTRENVSHSWRCVHNVE